MSWFREVAGLVDNVVKSDLVRGMILQANCDIYMHKTDRDNGYTEVKFANEGDDLEVLGEDTEIDGGIRVVNRDNHDQIETVKLTDLDDGMN